MDMEQKNLTIRMFLDSYYDNCAPETKRAIDSKYPDKYDMAFQTNIVGSTFAKNGQAALGAVYSCGREGFKVELIRDKDNEYDNNALAVYIIKKENGKSVRVGYINKELAGVVSPLIDEGIEVRVVDFNVYGGNRKGYNFGMSVDFKFIV